MVASRVVADPPLARFLFADTRLAPLWLVVSLGYAWFDAGWHKITDIGATTNYIIDGTGILAFWQRIAAIGEAGHHLRLVSQLHPIHDRVHEPHLVLADPWDSMASGAPTPESAAATDRT
jgi:hypothetical protein